MTHELASKTKAWTTLRGRETVALGRELLGGNGIVADFLVRGPRDVILQSRCTSMTAYLHGMGQFSCANTSIGSNSISISLPFCPSSHAFTYAIDI